MTAFIQLYLSLVVLPNPCHAVKSHTFGLCLHFIILFVFLTAILKTVVRKSYDRGPLKESTI